MNGTPERIRTSDRSVRSRVLYPAELRVRISLIFNRMYYCVCFIVEFNKIKNQHGASERIRTSDRSVRSRVLYPAELRMH